MVVSRTGIAVCLLCTGSFSNGFLAEANLEDNPKCTLYLAESTIPNAGMGMFSGIDLTEGNDISDGDICVPNIEVEWNNEWNTDEADNEYLWIWGDYDWQSMDMGTMVNEATHKDDVKGACPGFGAAINCHLALTNVEEVAPEVDSAGLHRSADPGVGAFTPYHNRRVKATKDTPAGAELFVYYGEHWFETRPDVYGTMPLSWNYAKADHLLKKYKRMKNRLDRVITTEMEHDLWHVITHLPYASRTMNALPKSAQVVQEATERGTSEVLLPGSVRSIEWLEENGKCLDNIRPGKSTIRQAGRGAFATRLIPRGSIVAPAPLIHIPRQAVLDMYDEIEHEDGTFERNMTSVTQRQMLLNYCFGHANSTLLLSPYGHFSNLINHNGADPNAKIAWADNKTVGHNPDWLNLSVDELGDRKHAGLAFDFIATRDILPGEEVFIDYGPEWEDAWNNHVTTWVPPEGSESYSPASVWNQDTETPLKTQSEQAVDKYPDNVKIACHPEARRYSGTLARNWSKMSSMEMKFETVDRNAMHECNITKRELLDGEIVYTADANDGRERRSSQYQITQAPRKFFAFIDQPYSSDSFLRAAFRHEIMIPDEMFPKAWMNKQ